MSSTEINASCACKGIRTCLLCEQFKNKKQASTLMQLPSTALNNNTKVTTYHYCQQCKNKAWLDEDHGQHLPSNEGKEGEPFITIRGVFVKENVITTEEEGTLISHIDSGNWVESQSGRRKQDFGPKVNFKKKKVKIADFKGFPHYIINIFNRIKNLPLLHDFNPVELCHLEYEPSKGSSIDPHFDDDWLWGERLVTINYLSSTYLTLTLPANEIDSHSKIVEIRIKMNPKSLLVLSSDARYKWMHCIKRTDIKDRRLASTWREATEEFKPGGKSYESIGKLLFEVANNII